MQALPQFARASCFTPSASSKAMIEGELATVVEEHRAHSPVGHCGVRDGFHSLLLCVSGGRGPRQPSATSCQIQNDDEINSTMKTSSYEKVAILFTLIDYRIDGRRASHRPLSNHSAPPHVAQVLPSRARPTVGSSSIAPRILTF